MSEKEEKECDFLESYSYEMDDETIGAVKKHSL